MAAPARAETAANRPVFLRKSRREVRLFEESFMDEIIQRLASGCQCKKMWNKDMGPATGARKKFVLFGREPP